MDAAQSSFAQPRSRRRRRAADRLRAHRGRASGAARPRFRDHRRPHLGGDRLGSRARRGRTGCDRRRPARPRTELGPARPRRLLAGDPRGRSSRRPRRRRPRTGRRDRLLDGQLRRRSRSPRRLRSACGGWSSAVSAPSEQFARWGVDAVRSALLQTRRHLGRPRRFADRARCWRRCARRPDWTAKRSPPASTGMAAHPLDLSSPVPTMLVVGEADPVTEGRDEAATDARRRAGRAYRSATTSPR